jgi:hypothetical protein
MMYWLTAWVVLLAFAVLVRGSELWVDAVGIGMALAMLVQLGASQSE